MIKLCSYLLTRKQSFLLLGTTKATLSIVQVNTLSL